MDQLENTRGDIHRGAEEAHFCSATELLAVHVEASRVQGDKFI